MTGNPKNFRIAIWDAAASLPAGPILALQIPSENRFRSLWCFYSFVDSPGSPPVGLEAWVKFYLAGSLVIEIPAYVKPTSTTAFGMAMSYLNGISEIPAIATYSNNIIGGNVLYWNTGDAVATPYPIHPTKLQAEADEVRLEVNQADTGNTRALLAVMSLPQNQ